jgi:mycothiol synthase
MTSSQTNATRLLPADGKSAGRPIGRVPVERRPEALAQLVARGGAPDHGRAQRFLEFARTNRIALDSLWAAEDDTGRIVDVVLAVPNVGRTAMFFASRPLAQRSVGALAAVIDHAAMDMALGGAHLGQALLEPEEHFEAKAFTAARFLELARLSYLERPLPRRKPHGLPPMPDGCRVEPFREELESDVVAALESSYEQTLDCPGLRGLRETRDILAGHRATGIFEPELWRILRLNGRAVGVLLMNPSPQHGSIELVYIGLAPEARGRGLGVALLRHGLSLVSGRGERTMNLAVDERNDPALRLYRNEGFTPALRRVAMIRPLRDTAAPLPSGGASA